MVNDHEPQSIYYKGMVVKSLDEEDLEHVRRLGGGGYGEVHEMRNTKDGTVFARKVIRGEASNDAELEKEVAVMERLCRSGHINIVQVLGNGKLMDGHDIHVYIDMEACEATLAGYLHYGYESPGLKSWSEVRDTADKIPRAYTILQHILNGLVYLHSLGSVHRDLKPQNVLFKGQYWKIADFGLTRSGTSKTFVKTHGRGGTPGYRAPELLRARRPEFNIKTDMWAFGCIAFELFCGHRPYANDDEVIDEKKIWHSSNVDEVTKYYTHDLLRLDPRDRPSSNVLLVMRFSTNVPCGPDGKRKREYDSLSPFVIAAIEWAASNSAQPQVFASLLRAGTSEKDVAAIVFRPTGDHVPQQRKVYIEDRRKAFEFLQTAIAKSDILTLLALLEQAPDPDELQTKYANMYYEAWASNPDVLMRPELKLKAYDKLNSEAVRCLIFRSLRDDVSQQAARLIFGQLTCSRLAGQGGCKVCLGAVKCNADSEQRRCEGWKVLPASGYEISELHRVVKSGADGQVCFNRYGTLLAHSCHSGASVCTKVYKLGAENCEFVGSLAFEDPEGNSMGAVGFSGDLCSTAISKDSGELVLYCTNVKLTPLKVTATLQLADPWDGKLLSVLIKKHRKGYRRRLIKFSPSGTNLVCLDNVDFKLRLYDCQDGSEVCVWRTSDQIFENVKISGDGRYIAAGTIDKVTLWWPESKIPVSIDLSTLFPKGIEDIAFRPFGNSLFVLARDSTYYRIWKNGENVDLTYLDPPVGTATQSKESQSRNLNRLSKRRLAFDSNAMASIVSHGTIRMYDVETSKKQSQALMFKPENAEDTPTVIFGPQGSSIFATLADGDELRIWEYRKSSDGIIIE